MRFVRNYSIAKAEKELNCFCQELRIQPNIYDLLVLFYLQIEGPDKPRYIEEYYKTLSNLPTDYWGDLSLATNEMLSESITFDTYKRLLADCITKENLRNVAIRLLFQFNEYLKERSNYPALFLERESLAGEIYILGPLNTLRKEYCFYLMPDCHYYKNFNREKGDNIRFLNQSEFSAIDERITSYKIIKRERLDKQVCIKSYDGTTNIQASYPEIKVGIVPVSKKLWCKIHYQEYVQKSYFELEDEEEYSDKMNEMYIKILQRCIDENIQIIIFPELAMNKKTLNEIRDFLIQSTLEEEISLELIFLGSLWDNGKNEGIMLSGTGTILMRNQKINPFFLKKDGKTYWEKLKQEAQKIELIDIPQIGRIQYLICKDGLDDSWQHCMWGFFEVAFSMISSYSESISYFENLGESFSTQYAGIQVLANACAPRIEKQNEIGLITIPCLKSEKRDAYYQKISYAPIEHCIECCFGECIRVFTICPPIMQEEVQILR